MYPLYWGPEVPCYMLSYLFSCCKAIPTLPVPLFTLLPVFSCVQSVHIPESPAKIQYQRFWTLITFFWLEIFQPNFGKSLRYMQISFSESLLRNCTATKKLTRDKSMVNAFKAYLRAQGRDAGQPNLDPDVQRYLHLLQCLSLTEDYVRLKPLTLTLTLNLNQCW